MLKSDLENFPHAISGSSIIVIVKVVCKMSDSVTFTSVAAKGTICEKGGAFTLILAFSSPRPHNSAEKGRRNNENGGGRTTAGGLEKCKRSLCMAGTSC